MCLWQGISSCQSLIRGGLSLRHGLWHDVLYVAPVMVKDVKPRKTSRHLHMPNAYVSHYMYVCSACV